MPAWDVLGSSWLLAGADEMLVASPTAQSLYRPFRMCLWKILANGRRVGYASADIFFKHICWTLLWRMSRSDVCYLGSLISR